MKLSLIFLALFVVAGCTRLESAGQTPTLTPIHNSAESLAMSQYSQGNSAYPDKFRRASLWSGGTGSLFGDRRATRRGDILTVVIEIDDSAEFSNKSARYRTGSESVSAPTLFGLESVVESVLPGDISLSSGLSTNSTSNASGDGSVRRNEKLTLRVAATVVEKLPNGVIRIQGSQEVRVNFEIRELLVSGFVRPEDISRRNEITYDKIASARVSYGGRGLISDVQRPRYGQEAADAVLPY